MAPSSGVTIDAAAAFTVGAGAASAPLSFAAGMRGMETETEFIREAPGSIPGMSALDAPPIFPVTCATAARGPETSKRETRAIRGCLFMNLGYPFLLGAA